MTNEIAIANIETGEVIQRPMTKSELEKDKLNQAFYSKLAESEKAEAEAKATAKAELLAKLGITADEAALLLS